MSHFPSRSCFSFSDLSHIHRWWWILYGFFSYSKTVVNLIFVFSGPCLNYQHWCCSIPKAKVPKMRYTVFSRGVCPIFSIILKGAACSHWSASVNSGHAVKVRLVFHSVVISVLPPPKPETSPKHCPLGTCKGCTLLLSPGCKCQLSPSSWPWAWLTILGFVWRRIIRVMIQLPIVKSIS